VHPSGAWVKTRKETAPRLGGGSLPPEFFEIVPEIKTIPAIFLLPSKRGMLFIKHNLMKK
jgi:hypothetical protein